MRFNGYYDRIITADELNYITQTDLEKSCINITSSEMYKEVTDYNEHMIHMRHKKAVYFCDFWGAFLLNIIVFLASLVILIKDLDNLSLALKLGIDNLALCYGFSALLTSAVIYFAFYRKNFSLKLHLPLCALLVCINYVFIISFAADIFLFRIIEKLDNSLKNDIGYPTFIQLNTLYHIEKDKNE